MSGKINGVPVTGKMLQCFADGAEAGYNLEVLHKRGRLIAKEYSSLWSAPDLEQEGSENPALRQVSLVMLIEGLSVVALDRGLAQLS